MSATHESMHISLRRRRYAFATESRMRFHEDDLIMDQSTAPFSKKGVALDAEAREERVVPDKMGYVHQERKSHRW